MNGYPINRFRSPFDKPALSPSTQLRTGFAEGLRANGMDKVPAGHNTSFA